jgi:hypothetical protein
MTKKTTDLAPLKLTPAQPQPNIIHHITKQKIILTILCLILASVIPVVRHYRDSATYVLNDPHPTFTYKCDGDMEDTACLEKTYQTYTEKKGVAAAFVKLESAYNTDPAVRANCHLLAHDIGRTEADSVGNLDKAYAQGNNFCWSGYYHGVMESIVSRVGAKNLPKDLPTICASIMKSQPYSFYAFNCVHGLGHGIMDVTDSNLFASLKLCDRLSGDWQQESCYGGVFMENEMDEVNDDHHTDYLKAGQPMYPCTAVANQYKGQCYLMQTSHALRVSNESFATVFKECGAVQQPFRDDCYQSLGRDSSGNSNSTVGPTVANCMLGQDSDAQENCIIGAVKDFISYYHSDTQADQLCKALDPSLQSVCQTTKVQYYATL